MSRFRHILAVLLLCLGCMCIGVRVEATAATVKVRVLSLFNLKSASISGVGLRYQTKEDGVFSSAPELAVIVRDKGLEVNAGDKIQFTSALTVTVPPDQAMDVLMGAEARSFVGRLQISAKNGVLFFVQELPLETYVASVLAMEMPKDFPAEAKKAQAVAIRSYALSHRGRHAAEGYDFCDTTHCQAYAGRLGNLGRDAAEATRGLILTDGQKPVAALYHSTCGGHTSAHQKVFGGAPLPYLQGVDDRDFCAASPHSQWSTNFSRQELSEALGYSVQNLRPEEREPAGRLFSVAVDSRTVAVMDFLSQIGKRWGWSRLKSNWFEVQNTVEGFHFTGRGLGHGVGLCQWGARGMAERGRKFPEILRHYFPGTRLERRL